MAERPTGAVTFLFTDVEGSTRAWDQTPEEMDPALEIHDQILREAIESSAGYVFATGGDSFSAAFSSPTSALTAAAEAQRGLVEAGCGLKVRMGVHSGEAIERDGNYFGPPLNQTARLMSIGHGGQVLVSHVTQSLVTGAGFEFLDLSEHRLADLSTPVRVAQLIAEGLDAAFPPLRSAVATDNLPLLGEVFGRSTDIDSIAEMLTERRLVTLTGAGGIGKTTLATSVALQMTEPFPDGRWMVDLTDLPARTDSPAIAGAVAGVDDRFGSVEALAPRRMLLILDNCEHVLDGAASYLTDLLATAPEVTVLATSREPLGLRGEKVVPVAPLSVDEDSEHASAVDLFVDRATEAGATLDLDTDHNTIVAICTAVGGLPLAIELAAARTAVMTPTQILERLGDRLATLKGGRGGPEHHRTIEATIAWSYDLLDEHTQQLLRLLSVFEGGFDLDQAEAIGGSDAVDRLADLVRKSLIQRDGDRLGMLEAVRQYATDRLSENGEEDEARRRHFDFFANWAHDVYRRNAFIELDQEERTWVTVNLVNLHAAVRWGADHGSPVGAAEIAETLWVHLIVVLFGRPQPNWFEPLLDHLDDLPPQLQLGVLHGAAVIEDWMLDNPDRARALMETEYQIHDRTGLVPRSGGTVHNGLGMVALRHGEWDDAIRWFRASVELGPTGSRFVSTANLATTLLCTYQATPQEALEMIDEARNEPDTSETTMWMYLDLLEADIRVRLGEHDQARQILLRTLRHLREANIRFDQQYGALSLLSLIERHEGHLDASATLLLEAIDLAVGHGLDPIWRIAAEAIDLADALIDFGHSGVASRVVASFLETNTFALMPWEADQIEELGRRIEQATRDQSTNRPDYAGLPLVDAVRQNLETATR